MAWKGSRERRIDHDRESHFFCQEDGLEHQFPWHLVDVGVLQEDLSRRTLEGIFLQAELDKVPELGREFFRCDERHFLIHDLGA